MSSISVKIIVPPVDRGGGILTPPSRISFMKGAGAFGAYPSVARRTGAGMAPSTLRMRGAGGRTLENRLTVPWHWATKMATW